MGFFGAIGECIRSLSGLEIWGGVECTLNRVGNTYFDQLHWNGHLYRFDDLERFAQLGLRTLRFPVQWERIEAAADVFDWHWIDERMAEVRRLGIRPIVGLLHHGSGPRWTSLLDPQFPERLARFAGAFARRFPEVDAYTPINEPLTTARFSALYGHWYPHARDDRSFLMALFHQYRAILLAMEAIRRVNSAALLIATEDIGKVHATPRLRYQADFENARRFMTYHWLRGTPPQAGPLAQWLGANGVDAAQMEWFRAHGDPGTIAGVNHYITSERYIDENVSAYAAPTHGGNGRDRYADTEAAAVGIPLCGWSGILREVHEHAPGPIAITEVHLGRASDEQIAWLMSAYDAAEQARTLGLDIRAVTVWSLLGSYNWIHLVTRDEGAYEPGVFDVRTGERRPTPLAAALRALVRGCYDSRQNRSPA